MGICKDFEKRVGKEREIQAGGRTSDPVRWGSGEYKVFAKTSLQATPPHS